MECGAAQPGAVGGEIARRADDAAGAVSGGLEVAGEVVMRERQQSRRGDVQAEQDPEKKRPRRATNTLPREYH